MYMEPADQCKQKQNGTAESVGSLFVFFLSFSVCDAMTKM